MRLVRHPLVDRDLAVLVDHIVETTGGDFAAAARRLDKVDALVAAIASNTRSGYRLGPPMDRWFFRHGGSGQRPAVVFIEDPGADRLPIEPFAFGAQD